MEDVDCCVVFCFIRLPHPILQIYFLNFYIIVFNSYQQFVNTVCPTHDITY